MVAVISDPPTDADINGLFAAILTKAFAGARLPLTAEKETQVFIAALLKRADIDHRREFRLNGKDIPDFWLPMRHGKGAVLEVKMNGARAPEVFRQLARYAADERVACLFLVTNRAMGLPATIAGKDAYYISMGRAWL